MTTAEILSEIHKLPLSEQSTIKKNLLTEDENEVWRKLFEEGLITHIPEKTFDEEDFEPIEIKGESLSETIIKERR